ncbi:MAG: ABC transporter ATP-binding protein [Pirellulales bacterium]
MNDGMHTVDVRGLTKVFGAGEGAVEALRGVDLQVARGEFVAVMGPSGSGKSTLLYLIGALDTPTAGTVCIDGVDLSRMDDNGLALLRRQRIGFIFQAFNLLDVLTAEENVSLPLVIDGVSEVEAGRRAAESLGLVGMSGRRHHLPGQLSGGEQQRLAIARALVTRPLLLLADEPTGNLDSANSDQIMRLLCSLAEEHGQTILMVTHDARWAAAANRVIRLRDGRVADEQTLPAARAYPQVVRELESQL